MLGKIAAFEFRYQIRNPVFWVTAAIFFLFSFGFVASSQIQIGDGGNLHENGPFSLMQTSLIFSIFFMFVTTAFVSNVVVRDDESGFGSIVRATRVTKFSYLFGRFIGAFAIAALAFLSVPLGVWVGSMMPWLDPETVGATNLAAHAFAYFALALPNILITSAIFFALATATRSMMATYIGVIIFLVAYFVALGVTRAKPELRETMGLVEPFGFAAFANLTRYWTAAERNSLVPSFDGAILYNRLLWIAISFAFLALAYSLYRFADKGASTRRQKRQLKILVAASSEQAVSAPAGPLPTARFDAPTARAQLWQRTRFEVVQVLKSPAFLVLMLIGLANTLPSLWFVEMFGTPTYPTTTSLLPILEGAFSIIPLLIAIYYAGELVWRERDRKMHEIIDATPLPNWAYVVPKTMAVSLVLIATVLISALGAVLVQILKGNATPEFDKYLAWYILPMSYDMIILAVLAVAVQAVSPNKYVGWGLMVLYVIATIIASSLGFEHNLYVYGDGPQVQYSDMNGAGIYWKGAWWFRLYWGAVALVLLVVAHLLWRRGTETRLKPRLVRAPARLRGTPGAVAAFGVVLAAVTGGWIFYNTNILNDYRISEENEQWQADYERKFLAYESLPQPSVTDVRLEVALYPQHIRADVSGSYALRNLTNQPIRHVHVRNPDRALEVLKLDFPGARLASDDEKFAYRIYQLDRPMMPGETRTLGFETRRWQRGFRNQGDDRRIVGNGTFLNNYELAPVIGMDRQGLLRERVTRRKYGLPSELRPAKLEDLSGTRKSYIGAAWTTADITVSTIAGQTPIAPGRKVADTTFQGRRTARFVSDAPILNFFSIQSARYSEKHRMHQGVDLGVYYDPQHSWNVDRMLDALQASLDYYQANFGPYQFDQARIIEFPGYESFAQAFANTMPYSEAIGFVADNSDPDTIDYVTYVTAHELGHQYWAHQVIGADMQGGTMLSETLAQYSALMVMKKLYGEDKIRRFLKFELDNYLRSRGSEGVEELPIARVENQGYVHYRKGSLAMYLLQERLGEDEVNRALRTLIARYKFKGAPYPRSLDLIQAFRAEAKSPEQQALITDLFERITLYDLKVGDATAVKRRDGKWEISVPIEAAKFYADGKGVESNAPLAESIEVGLFTAEPGRGAFDRKNVVVMEKRPIRSGRQVLRFLTDRKPSHAGVDPYNYFVDRNSEDNIGIVG